MECHVAAKDVTEARPDLWASDDPSAIVASEKQTGNANLLAFLCGGCLQNGVPPRYDELRRVNDGLRERGRGALVAWLCHMDRVPLPWLSGQFAQVPRDLSDIRCSSMWKPVCARGRARIGEAITAVQNFVRRARLPARRRDGHPRIRAAVDKEVCHIPCLAGLQASPALQRELGRVERCAAGAARGSVIVRRPSLLSRCDERPDRIGTVTR